ncbi:MAG TPA: hypoxanthine phosphoribosyltransferase [Opitutae bacterium]|nr:hypoxanthine phosphoribosyltransferase [Opitutae bacterium]|tara:strand:- start:38 stop:595 length:558 start_codon:yes stop_codon:yes gene_type:complete
MLEADLASVVVTEEMIRERIWALGAQITEDYRTKGDLTVLCVTNGAVVFAADLIRAIKMPLRLECISVSAYHDEEPALHLSELEAGIRLDLRGRHLLLMDDVIDTGRTLNRLATALAHLKPASLRTCVLISKEGRRQVNYNADYAGFEIVDQFVVGYGLDFAEQYRNLRCIGVLKSDFQNPPIWQ